MSAWAGNTEQEKTTVQHSIQILGIINFKYDIENWIESTYQVEIEFKRIDADEIIPEDLKQEILKKLESPNDCVAFKTYRQFYFKDQPLNYSGWQTDKVYRFFNKKHVFFEPTKFVHETLNVSGKTETLKYKLTHYSYKNYTDYKAKMERYALLRAQELHAKKLNPNCFHFYVKPFYRFFNHYIIRLGFLDGKNGLTICKLNAYGVKQRYVELKKLKS